MGGRTQGGAYEDSVSGAGDLAKVRRHGKAGSKSEELGVAKAGGAGRRRHTNLR